MKQRENAEPYLAQAQEMYAGCSSNNPGFIYADSDLTSTILCEGLILRDFNDLEGEKNVLARIEHHP